MTIIEISRISWIIEIKIFADSAVYRELITLILRVIWLNRLLLLNAKAYKFKIRGTPKHYKNANLYIYK